MLHRLINELHKRGDHRFCNFEQMVDMPNGSRWLL